LVIVKARGAGSGFSDANEPLLLVHAAHNNDNAIRPSAIWLFIL
jgi:hypothetical protein